MAKPKEDAGIACKGTLISVCEDCKSIHIALLDGDMNVVAVSNMSFASWLEMIAETVDDIDEIRNGETQPAAEGHMH